MFGFYRLAAAVPRLFLADVKSNVQEIIKLCKTASDNGAAAVVFPEMCITGYTIGDLVFQKTLLDAAENAAWEIAQATCNSKTVVIFKSRAQADAFLQENTQVCHPQLERNKESEKCHEKNTEINPSGRRAPL